ncbi:hypothetical protein [Novosphingobium sp. CCH12-A3]|nr:hypothetical protein [Novosphingobium sp. CCH12-A3]
MFKKILTKVVGKALAPIVDDIVKRELDRRTGGAASKIEDAVDAVKRVL